MSTYDELAKLGETSPAPAIVPIENKPTQQITWVRQQSSGNSRGKPRQKSRHVPTRNEIQEFSFRLRDQLKVKVQAEVPYRWQTELEEIARELKVKKLELYRFILGEFLGKVRRNASN
jgi:hypothetical protein